MPFTFSHPAIVLPLKKAKPRWFSVNGLVIGSMAPDFLYFFKMDGNADFGHTLAGIFLYDLPISFLIAITFHLWVRNILIMHLPSPLDKKYFKFLSFNFIHFLRKKWLSFTISVLIGVLSHLFWDSLFTPQGWIYYQAPSLFSKHFTIAERTLPLYILIERLESVFGLIYVIWIVLQQQKFSFTPEVALSWQPKIYYWGSLLIFTFIISGLKLWVDPSVYGLGSKIVIFSSAFLLALIFTTTLVKLFSKEFIIFS